MAVSQHQQMLMSYLTQDGKESKCPLGYSVQVRYVTSNWFGEKLLVPIGDEYKYTKIVAPHFYL